jgi:Flp pilus assembly protein TadB
MLYVGKIWRKTASSDKIASRHTVGSESSTACSRSARSATFASGACNKESHAAAMRSRATSTRSSPSSCIDVIKQRAAHALSSRVAASQPAHAPTFRAHPRRFGIVVVVVAVAVASIAVCAFALVRAAFKGALIIATAIILRVHRHPHHHRRRLGRRVGHIGL